MYTKSNKKVGNNKHFDLIELYNNFGIKFIMIWPHMKKLRIFFEQNNLSLVIQAMN